jgi:nickel/cobalt transporter (NiCoT) family protein
VPAPLGKVTSLNRTSIHSDRSRGARCRDPAILISRMPMVIPIRKLFVEQSNLRAALVGIYSFLLLANIAAWAWAVVLFRHQPLFVGTALLAYSLGLRHAVDADHIAAIDNVTRKLMQEGKRPVSVGFFFALGHSTVVALAAAVIAGTTALLRGQFEQVKSVGSVVGTLISVVFLFVIAIANLVILFAIWRTFRHVQAGGRYVEDDFDILLNSRGLLARLFRPAFRLVRKGWHMFPLGFLFGLGFGTATEVTLLGISATQVSNGVSIWSIMVFPALFAAGMSLIDTTDGVLMLGAYSWAFIKPMRKLYYNLIITFVSVVVALLIGGIEALGLLGKQLNLSGSFWESIAALNDNFNNLGFLIIGVFIAAWIGSIVFYRYKGLDDVKVVSASQ